MKHFFSLILLFTALNAFSQIDAGTDITICEIEPVNLSAIYTPNSVGTSDYTIESIPFNPDSTDGFKP